MQPTLCGYAMRDAVAIPFALSGYHLQEPHELEFRRLSLA